MTQQMKTIEAELERVRAEMAKLQIEEALLLKMRAAASGEPLPAASTVTPMRKRATSVKPMILEVMHNAGANGMASTDVAAIIKDRVPEVAKDTVSSVLSRLKGDGALVYVGDRYYEKQFKPLGMGFEAPLRAVS